ncbi:MAG: TIGR01212 family radical SAM protein [Clostridiales bacterium]|nr:TIGR01212 family radical SAM protein [Clostridiales bacterium]
MEKDRYNHLNKYLKELFGERVLKICIDGNFTCPNRDGSKAQGGCIFCSERGSGDLIKNKCDNVYASIKNQVEKFLTSYRGERANKFIAYFQNFSNTYDSIENLKKKYDISLNSSDKIIGLEIATRPDLITDEVVELLSTYKDNYYVTVELGLQTANDKIGEIINRCYKTEDFVKACSKLKTAGINVVGHLMVGLPNESKEDILRTVKVFNECNCDGIKIHSTHILKNTELEKMYIRGEYSPITLDYYVEMVGMIISNLNSDIIIHRVTADPPKEIFVAPDWQLHKKIVLNSIERYLKENNITQGCEK